MKKTGLQNKQGKIISNGVKLEPHEMDTVLLFISVGKTLELVVPSNTPHSRRPDFVMDGLEWEVKSPVAGTRRALERNFYDASNQSSNIVVDLRRIKGDTNLAVSILEKCFSAARKVRRMYVITKYHELKFYKK